MPAHDQKEISMMSVRTLSFTEAEKKRIERAAKVCGWETVQSAIFARQCLLRSVSAILKGDRKPRPGDLLRQRLRFLMSRA
jgi:hypothetical protein